MTNVHFMERGSNFKTGTIEFVEDANGEKWLKATTTASRYANYPNIQKLATHVLDELDILNWKVDLLSNLDRILGDIKYAGIKLEIEANSDLLNYFKLAEENDWAKWGLAAISKRSTISHPIKNSSKFVEFINDYEVPINNINRRLKDLEYIDETTSSDLGYLFDNWLENQVVASWDADNFSSLPTSIASRLQTLKSDYVLIPQAHVSIRGKSPVPDFLFVRKKVDALGNNILDKSDCIFIDSKLLWNTGFSSTQNLIVSKVTASNGAVVKSLQEYSFELNNPNMTIELGNNLTIKKVETFSVNQDIKLVNLNKKP